MDKKVQAHATAFAFGAFVGSVAAAVIAAVLIAAGGAK